MAGIGCNLNVCVSMVISLKEFDEVHIAGHKQANCAPCCQPVLSLEAKKKEKAFKNQNRDRLSRDYPKRFNAHVVPSSPSQ